MVEYPCDARGFGVFFLGDEVIDGELEASEVFDVGTSGEMFAGFVVQYSDAVSGGVAKEDVDFSGEGEGVCEFVGRKADFVLIGDELEGVGELGVEEGV